MKLSKTRLNFVSNYAAKKNYFYRAIDSANLSKKISADKNSIVSLIADALSGEKNAVSLVARSTDNNLEMEKDWELMSDLDKDEILHQKIFRAL